MLNTQEEERQYNLREFERVYHYSKSMPEEYLQFSMYFQNLFIDNKDGSRYVIDTGNFQTVNLWMLRRIENKIRKHPLIFKLLFRI